MLRRPHRTTLETLEARAADARVAVAAADAAVERAQFAVTSQAVLAERARKLEVLIAEHDGYDAQRTAISARVGEASRSVWDLNTKVENARAAVDAALAQNDTNLATFHGNNVGALSLTLQRAQQNLEAVQNEYMSVPHGTVDDDDRRNAAEYRAISTSPARSAAFMTKEIDRGYDGTLMELGRYAQAHPHLMRTNTTGIQDNRA